jgi:TPR repeat protein
VEEIAMKWQKNKWLLGVFLGFCLLSLGRAQGFTDEKIEEYIKTYEVSGTESDGRAAVSSVQIGNYKPGIDWFVRQASAVNSAQANYYAGEVLLKSDPDKAMNFYKKAKAQGSRGATFTMADMYFKGSVIKQDKKLGCELYREGIGSDSTSFYAGAYALCLDSVLEVITGFKQSPSDACNWYGVDARRLGKLMEEKFLRDFLSFDAAYAYLAYGFCLSSPAHGRIDLKASTSWIQASALLKNPYGTYLHAINLLEGVGILQDSQLGLKTLQESASLGSDIAQNRLGTIYAEGKAVTKNMLEAYKWFLIASANGYENAKANKEKAEKAISMADIQKGQQMAKRWMEQNKSK